ncbi:hotdog fold domain-containing protein [Fontimonas sp. SYSU GA230001]|uniref:PaaI family thioesterase n=1 Tax=Fontimonas sp. SYSU GA230001 TaxID=3142450 RepID=UPI0032B3B851
MNVLIDPRFCGPPASGNGGYSCGLLAQHLPGSVEVTLKAPPPLGVDLQIDVSGHAARMTCDGQVIAEARVIDADWPAPPPRPDFEAAVLAATRYAGFRRHDYPTCFACGPDRAEHDGLRIFSGPWRDGIVAAPWIADDSLADAQGTLPVPVLWAAIDCAGYWAATAGLDPGPAMLLGRMSARFDGSVRAGERCIVSGWTLGVDGRKHRAGTALFGADGRCVGQSRQTWIALKGER